MSSFFATLTHAIESAAPWATAGAFVWGVLSVVLSPCHLASIPLIVGFITEQQVTSVRRAFTISALFAAGILLTIGVIGAITASLGRMLGDVGAIVNYLLALIFVLLGLHFLGVVPLPWSSGPQTPSRRGLLGAFILGLVFGIGVGPCTFAYMAPMLAVTLKVASTSWWYGVLLLLAYGVGHCTVITVAGTSVQRVQRALQWSQDARAAQLLRRTCGVLVIMGGVYLVYTAP
jgi:cytochrome c-type biogenesis protein